MFPSIWAEFDKLCLICDLAEKETMKIARFIRGLNRHIAKKVELSPYSSFNDVCKLAIKIESHQQEEKPKSKFHDSGSSVLKGFEQFKPNFSQGSSQASLKTPSTTFNSKRETSSKDDKKIEKPKSLCLKRGV